jgi:formylglycine-generating enzyme required for sulfatase activity
MSNKAIIYFSCSENILILCNYTVFFDLIEEPAYTRGMDYLQNLELQMMTLQRKVRLLEDLKVFADTATHEEILAFGEALKAVHTASGSSLGSLFGMIAGATPPPLPETPSPKPKPVEAPVMASGPIVSVPDVASPSSAPASELSAVGASSLEETRSAIESSMKSIPAGSFMMGSESVDDEKPLRKISLGTYRMCDHLVTNKEYSLFVAANSRWAKNRAEAELRDDRYLEEWGEEGYPEGKDDNPVAFVSYFAAAAFAEWVGKRLPTEAEWERAARGGLVGKKFPNGDQMNDKLANLAKQYRGTTPVRNFEPNGFGLYDMAGNLFEWCSDWYGPYAPGEAASPKGPSSGEYRVVRGGSWMSGANALRVSARVDMESRTCGYVGIRIVDGG